MGVLYAIFIESDSTELSAKTGPKVSLFFCSIHIYFTSRFLFWFPRLYEQKVGSLLQPRVNPINT